MSAGGRPATVTGGGSAGAAGDVRLDVRELDIRRGQRGPLVVSGVSFAVRPGEVLGLVGESGSGKTTVALALLGHTRRGLSISRGEIRLDGADLLRLGPAELRQVRGARVSYVPQDPAAALNPALRIGYQLREALRVHPYTAGPPEARVLEVMREASLDATPDMLRRYPHQLSGGQQQRVALAMAFACRPALIVLDEPTTGLDVSTQRHILDTVRGLCRGYQVAAVYVSHDLAVVSELVAEVAVMYAGRVVESGPAGPLFGRPLHPYTQGLLASVPAPDRAGRLTGIPGQQPPPGRRGPGCTFAPRCEFALGQCRAGEPEQVVLADRTVRCVRVTQIAAGPPRPSPSGAADAAPAGAAVLAVRGVSARYGSGPVLSGIDLDVPARACVAIVGESGSGKTTLARCITGLHRNWTGEMALQGVPLAPAARDRPKQVLQADPVRVPESLHLAQSPEDGRPDRGRAAAPVPRPVPARPGRAGGQRIGGRLARPRLPVPVSRSAVRRGAAAGRDRPRPGGRAGPARVRRGHLGAGRVGAGGDRGTAPRRRGRASSRHDLHHAQPAPWSAASPSPRSCCGRARSSRRGPPSRFWAAPAAATPPG